MEWISFKDAIVAALGLSRDTLHMATGLGAFGLVALLLRCPLNNVLPWACVFALSWANEALDQMASYAFKGGFDWAASLHDFGYTLLLPTLLMAIGSAARLAFQPARRRAAHRGSFAARRAPARAMAARRRH